MRKRLQAEPGLRIIDTGYTSPANINYLTSLGHSVFLADLVHDAYAQELANRHGRGRTMPIWNVEGFLDHALNFAGRIFDMVLLWTALDYLPEPLVAPVVARLYAAMNPGGQVLAFFTRACRARRRCAFATIVTPGDDVEMQMTSSFPSSAPLPTAASSGYLPDGSAHRQFLAKDSVSEVIMTR